MPLAILLFGLLTGPYVQEGALRKYVAAPDQSFAWLDQARDGLRSISLTSQTWHETVWKHDLVFVEPAVKSAEGTAIIEVTGWEPNQKDYSYAKLLADSSGLTVCLLFQIPNQPLWGREEDGLIAYTVEKFLTGGGDDWPLLFPMVKSVKAAMDAIQQSTKRSGSEISRFIVTGASKRGWTTWLSAGIGDPRVIGIAPAVFDNLNMDYQLERQLDYWGSYSPMIRDYTDKGLPAVLKSERGQALIQMVDPIHYLDEIGVPTLVLTATNDPFWTVDSLRVYWDELVVPKWTLAIPNAGHGMGDRAFWAPSIGWFAKSCATKTLLPFIRSRIVEAAKDWELLVSSEPGPVEYTVWTATSWDLHFEKAEWKSDQGSVIDVGDAQRSIRVKGRRLRSANQALFVELRFKDGREVRRLTTPVYLIKKSSS